MRARKESSPVAAEPKRALLIRNANSFDFGGAERFVVALAKELNKNDWEATVVSRHRQIAIHAKEQGVPFIKGHWLKHQDFSGWRIALTPFYALWQLMLISWYKQLIRETKADVIHPQGRDDFIAATIAGKACGIKVVWTDHADLKHIYKNVPDPVKNPGGKWVNRESRKADAITMVSHSEENLVKESLHTEALPNNYHVIYNGVLDRKVKPVERTKDEQKAVIFGVTSRLVTAKGIGELIEAFQNLDTKKDVRLWIIGDGPEAAEFRKMAAGNNHIVFKGFQEDALPYLAACDVFVHPTHHEGFSLSIVEAAMLGKPMLATDVGGNPEIVHDKENGLLVPAKDALALKNAMQTLAEDSKLRTTYGKSARKTYLKQFKWDTIVKEKFIPLYEAQDER